jgi:hypothetical protein
MEMPMAPDERDRSFDKALSRHLRSAANPGVSANLPSSPAAPSASCLNSETLAAYHERSLLPEEMNSCKDHIVGCAHCQAILAQLEATDSILLPVEKKEVRIMDVAAPVAAAARDRAAAQPALPHKAPFPRSIRAPRWRWLAPAGALAAGLLVWVAWYGEKPRLQEPSTPAPPVTKQAPASSSPDQLADLSKTPAAIGGMASAKIPRELGTLKQQGKFDSRARVTLAKPPAGEESSMRKDGERYSSDALLRDENQLDLGAKNAEVGETREKLETQNQPANIQAQNQMISPKVPGPGPLNQADNKKKESKLYRSAAAPEPAPPKPATQTVTVSDATTSLMLAEAASNPSLISPQGSNVIWHAGRAGLIEFSNDRGSSWSRQSSGVLVDLLTGSAPSEKVCWIVGRVGAILRTTDGGAHWSLSHSPLDEDLGGVRAVDALQATVWNLRNTKTFETSDGGATWKPVLNP